MSLLNPFVRVAVIVTVPGVRAVTTPDELTDATVALLLDQEIVWYEEVDGVIDVVYVCVSPSSRFNVVPAV